MRQSRFAEAETIRVIKEQEAGLPTVEICRKHGLSTATYHKPRASMAAWRCSIPADCASLRTRTAS